MQRVLDELRVRLEPHLFQEAGSIGADALRAHRELARDGLHRPAGRELTKDVVLPIGETLVRELVVSGVDFEDDAKGLRRVFGVAEIRLRKRFAENALEPLPEERVVVGEKDSSGRQRGMVTRIAAPLRRFRSIESSPPNCAARSRAARNPKEV